MRLVIAALLALPSIAAANPTVTAGVSGGLAQSKGDADLGLASSQTLGLYGRLGLTPRLGAELEVSRIEMNDTAQVDLRSMTALLVVDLADKGHVVPTLMAGFGLDSLSTSYGTSQDAHHIEGGLGLEYRADNGIVVGADVRLGGRTLHQNNQVYPQTVGVGVRASNAPSQLTEGEYRAGRVFVGVKF